MSASAGKVMPRPMGDYNALTEYKVLDIVTYNDRPYMAKQTTTGNLPTNTTYWMLLLDFPTEVDNVPTQNSPNLVKSGGVYSATADKMKIDGSNATNFAIGKTTTSQSNMYVNIAKDAGDNQPVTLTVADNIYSNEYYASKLAAHIGDTSVAYSDDGMKNINIQSVTISNNQVVATAYLVVDDSATISLSMKSLDFKNYVKSGKTYNLINGVKNASTGDSGRLSGTENTITGDYCVAEGYGCSATGTAAHAEGKNTFASGNYSFAEGEATAATSARSHAAGEGTIAGYGNQFVCGYYNNNKDTIFEVGSGSSSTRRNAFEVYSDGTFSCNDGTDKYKFAKNSGEHGFYDGSGNFHSFQLYKELVNNSVVLSTSTDTTVTFSDASITADSTIEPFTSVYSIAPKDCVASAGQCVVTIPKQSTAQTIKVKIRVS